MILLTGGIIMKRFLALFLLCLSCVVLLCGCDGIYPKQEEGYEIAIERFLNAFITEDYTYQISSNTPITSSDAKYEECLNKVTKVFGCTENDVNEMMDVNVDVHCSYSDYDETISFIVVNIDDTYRAFAVE